MALKRSLQTVLNRLSSGALALIHPQTTPSSGILFPKISNLTASIPSRSSSKVGGYSALVTKLLSSCYSPTPRLTSRAENNVRKYGCRSWWSPLLSVHNSIQPPSYLTVTRSFCTLSVRNRQCFTQLYIAKWDIKSFRRKHSLPKVPPTRMMSVYDMERSITDEEAAKQFVYALKAGERKYLYEELARFHGDTTGASGAAADQRPTRAELKLVALHQMFPFIGFGFLDNFLMIVAGEYIDLMLGASLGISTMAAAALGNWFSDVCGLGSAHYVENFVTRFGIRHPHLSPAQVDMKCTKWASNWGKVIGVTIGCLLGMFPLLFFKNEKTEEAAGKDKNVNNDQTPQMINKNVNKEQKP